MPFSQNLSVFPNPLEKNSDGTSWKAISKQAEAVPLLFFIAEIKNISSWLPTETVSNDFFITLNCSCNAKNA